MRKTSVAAAIAVVLFAGSAIADEVKKKDGTVLEGEIIAEDDDSVTIKHRLGEIKIPRKEVESIEKKPVKSVEADLDKIKKTTMDKLDALAKEAEKGNRKDAAKAIREIIEDVKNWSTTPRADKTEKTNEEKKKTPTDYAIAAGRFGKVNSDTKLTDLQRQKAQEVLRDEYEGKPVKAAVKVTEITPVADGSAQVRGTVGTYEVLISFFDPDDVTKLGKTKRGATLSVEGVFHTDQYLGIDSARLGK